MRLEHTAHRILFALVRARRARRRTSRSSRGRTVMMVRSPLAGPLAIIVAVILLANLARVYAPRARTPLPHFPSQRALSRAFVGRAASVRSKRDRCSRIARQLPVRSQRDRRSRAQRCGSSHEPVRGQRHRRPRAQQQPVHSQRDRRSRASRVGVGCAFAVSKRSDLSHAFALHQRMRAESTC